MEPPRGAVGETLDIGVKVNRGEGSAATKPAAPAAGAAGAAAAAAAGKGPQDELIAALPKLEPGDTTPKVPSEIKMRVLRKLENGDVLVEATRASVNEWDANSIRAVSRIPRMKLAGNQPLTTMDLVDVNWYEQQGANTIERESSGWEDEYSLRWAGFEEARSKIAIELENKRKDMQKVKERLQDRINNMSKERGQIAQERERVRKLREEAEVKLNELTRKVDEQGGLIEQQKDTIKKQQTLLDEVGATPEKPGKNSAVKTIKPAAPVETEK